MGRVTLNTVGKSFGAVDVLFDIDLDISPGEFVVLVGPSGCGKSTLLRMIAGLEHVSRGDLLIDDVRANDIAPSKRNIAMVFQSYALFPHYTVRENMAFGPKLRGEPLDKVAGKINEAARMLDLEALLDRKPAQLSGGQRQRVAMGRAIVREPSIFLFDEPLSNLDAKLRVTMRTEIKALHQKLGNTIVYVTHDQVEAMSMADRIVIMNRGRIEQEGSPASLYDRPLNAFVAGFMGSPAMNFIEGTYHPQGYVACWNDLRIACIPKIISLDKKVTVGLRPESIEVVKVGETDMSATVTLVEPTGADTVLHVDAAGVALTICVRRQVAAAKGDTIGLRVKPQDVHLFDAKTGQRLS